MPPVQPRQTTGAEQQLDVASGTMRVGTGRGPVHVEAQQDVLAAERDVHHQHVEPLKHLFGDEPVHFLYTMDEYRQICAPTCTYDSAAIITSSGNDTCRHIVRTRFNIAGCPTSITQKVADRLGLARVSLGGGGGRCALVPSPAIPLQVLVDPLEIKLMRSHDDVALTWKAPVVFVVPGASSFWEMQLGFDFHQVFNAPLQFFEPGTLIRRVPSPDSGHVGSSSRAPPFLVPYIAPRPNQEHVLGSSTFYVADDTWQQAYDIALAREGVRAHRATAGRAAVETEFRLVMTEVDEPAREVYRLVMTEANEPAQRIVLVAKPWPEVADQHVPIDNYTCAICMEDMNDTHEQQQTLASTGAEVRQQLFVQLRCRHTFCELCLEKYVSVCTARGDSSRRKCPVCREPLIN